MNLQHISILVLTTILLIITDSAYSKAGMTIAEIKAEIAKSMRADYFKMLESQVADGFIRTARTSRGGYRNSVYQSPFHHASLILAKRFQKRRFANLIDRRSYDQYLKELLKKHYKSQFVPFSTRRHFPVVDIHSPSLKKDERLVNRLQQAFAVTKTGIRGTNNIKSDYTHLQMQSVGFAAVLIKGVKANKYICMKYATGEVYVTDKKSLECVFLEKQEMNYYHTYQAFLHRKNRFKWFLGINSDGEVMSGKRSKFHKKSSQFTKISV